jgi:hypothetical protein
MTNNLLCLISILLTIISCDLFAIKKSLKKDLLDSKKDAIAFAEWLLNNSVIEEDDYYWRSLKDLKRISSEQLYELYQQSKTK